LFENPESSFDRLFERVMKSLLGKLEWEEVINAAITPTTLCSTHVR